MLQCVGRIMQRFMLCCVLLWFGTVEFLPMSFRVTSLALGQPWVIVIFFRVTSLSMRQSPDCPSVSEAARKNMGHYSDGISSHWHLDCLRNRLFRRRSKKISKLHVTGLWPVVSPHKGPVTWKMFPFDEVIMVCIIWAKKKNLYITTPKQSTTKHCTYSMGHTVQYIQRNMHTVFALLCFVVVIHWLIFPYPSGLLHWHCGNLTIAPVPAKQPWWIWINTSCEFIMNDCITTTKQSTTKPCAYFLGYTVHCQPHTSWYHEGCCTIGYPSETHL